jgi:hypothetical protein
MPFSKSAVLLSLALSVVGTALYGCGKQNTYSADSDTAKALAAQAKSNALQPAVGHYTGKMHMKSGDAYFVVTLDLAVNSDNVHSSDSTDPTDTAEVPTLKGGMNFPAIENAGSSAYATLPDLMKATGGEGTVPFPYGYYVPGTQKINLPFTIPGYSGTFGSVVGDLKSYSVLDNRTGKTVTVWKFTGIWYSDSSQEVGTFDFTKDGSS